MGSGGLELWWGASSGREEGAPLSQLLYRQAASNPDLFNRLGGGATRPGGVGSHPPPRLPFPLPLTGGLFPRIPAPFNLNSDGRPPPPFPFPIHPLSQFHGRPFPFPGPPHFLPNFKSERDVDGDSESEDDKRRHLGRISANGSLRNLKGFSSRAIIRMCSCASRSP